MKRVDIEQYMKDKGLSQIDLILKEEDSLAVYCVLKGGKLNDYTGHVVDRRIDIWGRLAWKNGKSERIAWEKQ